MMHSGRSRLRVRSPIPATHWVLVTRKAASRMSRAASRVHGWPSSAGGARLGTESGTEALVEAAVAAGVSAQLLARATARLSTSMNNALETRAPDIIHFSRVRVTCSDSALPETLG